MRTPLPPEAAAVATALERRRHQAARAVFAPVENWDKYAGEVDAQQGGLDRYLQLHFYVFADCLALYFRTGDRTYADLYVGEMIQLLTWPGDAGADARKARVRTAVEASGRGVVAAVAPDLGDAERQLLEAELSEIERVLTTESKAKLEVLMVGDCLYRDVMAFLMAPAVEDGVTIVPTFLTTKNPAELRNEIAKLKDRAFDVVFYSPFTYEQSPEYAQTHGLKMALARPATIRAVADEALAQAEKTLDLLAELFECAIYVHDSANVRRHDGAPKERLRDALTRWTRGHARAIVNGRIRGHVAKRNAASFEHVFVLDESRFLNDPGEAALGKTFYDSDEQHPAALGKLVARDYRDILAVHAHLAKKKLVVCDLDNTLWKGVIGEGAVEHYVDKQAILKRLKAKGVVLAINSKNDPKNVKWDGGVLGEGDFVCSQITWDPKVANMRRIEAELNLKPKDFVFLDDRPDERAMVEEAFPGLLAMDATDERTWQLLDRWATILRPADEDRTEFYKQRQKRQEFLDAGNTEDPGVMFEKLGLEATIREAEERDLKRVAELINRTNQFNTCGARTSLREVTDWHASSKHAILVVDAKDKFGSMGTIAIAILHEQVDKVEIPIFVLSCRVFGYRIEDAVLDAAKRRAARAGLPLVGRYKETPHNGPCRKAYPDNGFTWDGEAWVFAVGAAPATRAPGWLRVVGGAAAAAE